MIRAEGREWIPVEREVRRSRLDQLQRRGKNFKSRLGIGLELDRDGLGVPVMIRRRLERRRVGRHRIAEPVEGQSSFHGQARSASRTVAFVSGDDVLAAVDEDDLPLNHRRLRASEEGDQPGVVVVGDVASARIACGFAGEKGVRFFAE